MSRVSLTCDVVGYVTSFFQRHRVPSVCVYIYVCTSAIEFFLLHFNELILRIHCFSSQLDCRKKHAVYPCRALLLP